MIRKINENGKIFVEIGCDQAEDVSCLMKENGYKDVNITRDLCGLDRVVSGTLMEG